jgi:hypothetical protein
LFSPCIFCRWALILSIFVFRVVLSWTVAKPCTIVNWFCFNVSNRVWYQLVWDLTSVLCRSISSFVMLCFITKQTYVSVETKFFLPMTCKIPKKYDTSRNICFKRISVACSWACFSVLNCQNWCSSLPEQNDAWIFIHYVNHSFSLFDIHISFSLEIVFSLKDLFILKQRQLYC